MSRTLKFLVGFVTITWGLFFATISAADAQDERSMSGSDLNGWTTVVGDGIWASAGEAPVSDDDIGTQHLGQHSLLEANLEERAVMAHNITYLPIEDADAFSFTHTASFQFRLTELPDFASDSNAQTFEAGLFIWDGSGDRRDHGLGFQWSLNPHDPNFGQIRKWSMSRSGWRNVTFMEPDTEWHTVTMTLDPDSKYAEVCIDDFCIDRVYTKLRKPSSWGTETAARLQTEIISLDPGTNSSAPTHQVEVRDWTWDWT